VGKQTKVKSREQALSAFALILARKLWETMRKQNMDVEAIEDALSAEEVLKVTEYLMSRYFQELSPEDALCHFSPEDAIMPDHWEAICYKNIKTVIRVLALESATMKVIDRARLIVERWFSEGPSLRIYDNDGRTRELGPEATEILRNLIANIAVLN